MTSHRPYLLRALWEWIVDNGMTPHLLVDATQPGVRVPPHAIKDGRVVLNIADRAVARLELGNDAVTFSARFGGVSHAVVVPMPAVLAVYARETGQGMALPEDALPPPPADDMDAATPHDSISSEPGEPDEPQDDPPPPRRGNHLRIVK